MLMCSLLDVLKSLLCVFGLELGKYPFVFYPHGFTPNHNPVPKTGAQLFQHLEIMEGSNEFDETSNNLETFYLSSVMYFFPQQIYFLNYV